MGSVDRRRWLTASSAVVVLAGVLVLAGPAWAQQDHTWAVLPFEGRGVDRTSVATFRDLLQVELSSRMNSRFVGGAGTPCADTQCALDAGAAEGADVVVWGSVSALGSELVVSCNVTQVPGGEVRSAQRITVSRVEELDTAAERIAEAVVTGGTVSESAELGNITEEEAQAATRRDGDHGFGIRLGAMLPLGESYADAGVGMLLDFMYWFETLDWAIEARTGLRRSLDDDLGLYYEYPIDIGAFWIMSRSDVAPFIGGGGGLRYITECRNRHVTTGTVVTTTQTQVLEDDSWAFGMFARVGALLLRTYTVRLFVALDYNVNFADLNGFTPQALQFSLGVIF